MFFLPVPIAEILELAGNAARDNKKGRVTPRHILLAVANDEELNQVGALLLPVPSALKQTVMLTIQLDGGWCFIGFRGRVPYQVLRKNFHRPPEGGVLRGSRDSVVPAEVTEAGAVPSKARGWMEPSDLGQVGWSGLPPVFFTFLASCSKESP